MTTPVFPWTFLCPDSVDLEKVKNVIQQKPENVSVQVIKARNPSVNGSFDEPVRKGRKPEVSKHHPAVLKCRELHQQGIPLHRVAIEVGVDYSMLARWYDKGWMDNQRKRKTKNSSNGV